MQYSSFVKDVQEFLNKEGFDCGKPDGYAGKKTLKAWRLFNGKVSIGNVIDKLLQHEGGYVNHPNDPGGETKFGISKRSYPNLDIKNITIQQAKEIYKRDYWDKCRLSELKDQDTANVIFDMAVNMGIKRASAIAQKACGATVDGVIGSKTIEKLNNGNYVNSMVDLRLGFYRNLINKNSKFNVFKKGWFRRAESYRI